MPMLSITADGSTPRLHEEHGSLSARLHHALRRDDGPITIMVHGYKYQPGHPIHCPHTSLFASTPAPHPRVDRLARIISWPQHLGLRGQPGEGLGLSFGWHARGTIWRAYRQAEQAGVALADLIARLRQLDPTRQINLITHSLGARVALSALERCAHSSVQTAILLAPAEFAEHAHRVLMSEQARTTQVLCVTSRENDLYDFMLEQCVSAPSKGGRVIGHEALRLPNLTTLQLDDPDSLTALRHLGYHVAAPTNRICHWSPYLRPGVFTLYRAVLSGTLALPHLRAQLPHHPTPRWSRLLPRAPRLPANALVFGR